MCVSNDAETRVEIIPFSKKRYKPLPKKLIPRQPIQIIRTILSPLLFSTLAG